MSNKRLKKKKAKGKPPRQLMVGLSPELIKLIKSIEANNDEHPLRDKEPNQSLPGL